VGILGSVAAALLIWLTVRPPRYPNNITVTLAGYTNGPAGERLAIFNVTNVSERAVRQWGVYSVEQDGRGGVIVISFSRVKRSTLNPGAFDSIAIPVPAHLHRWRVVFSVSPHGWRTDFADWLRQSSGSKLLPVVPSFLKAWPSGGGCSQWIEQ
jgi:hypothetical protein